MLRVLRKVIRKFGVDVVPYRSKSWEQRLPPDLSASDRAILKRVSEFTMTSIERQVSLMDAVRHVVRRGIEGSLVECGVWRGGSSMISALTLLDEGVGNRDLYLYDTFEGMTPPTEADRAVDGTTAQTYLEQGTNPKHNLCIADLADVERNMKSTNYPADKLHLIKGPIENTIPQHLPTGPIALLRLDTDWYESTNHELVHLFPLLNKGGVLIIDDYGHWEGARKAVDEYLSNLPEQYYLHRIDYTGRLLIK